MSLQEGKNVLLLTSAHLGDEISCYNPPCRKPLASSCEWTTFSTFSWFRYYQLKEDFLDSARVRSAPEPLLSAFPGNSRLSNYRAIEPL